ncbi:tRNA 2'-phosphotransferase, variant 2 [Stygiomarasmius scandens]|uniref:2'-phosphotransferase n=1 Tax=Marasmiellus scandens TaxID=2682957 RepID=A0ABR1JU05_9AGAR
MHLVFSQKNLLQYAALTTRSYGASAIRPWKKNPILKGSNPGKLPTAQDARRLQISKTMTYLLRHGKSECINMRSDGFVPVNSLLSHPSMRGVSFSTVETVAKKDDKKRFALSYEPRAVGSSGQMESWWIRANQGHSLPVQVEMKRIIRANEIPMAVHGTTENAWRSISANGLSKMNRNHIHMAQGLEVDGVVSGELSFFYVADLFTRMQGYEKIPEF